MQQLEMSVDRQLLAGMVARAVRVTLLTEVGNDWRHETADSGMVARDHVAPETLWMVTVIVTSLKMLDSGMNTVYVIS